MEGNGIKNIKNRKPVNYNELMAILTKEHEETFKDITLEAQLDKFVDELEEYNEAENPLDEARELADLFIVAAGVARFAPRFAKEFMVDKIIDMIDEEDEYGRALLLTLLWKNHLSIKIVIGLKKAASISISNYGRVSSGVLLHNYLT